MSHNVSDSKLIIGVLQVDRSPWTEIRTLGQETTWFKRPHRGVTVINLFGRRPNRGLVLLDKIHEGLRRTGPMRQLLARFDGLLGESWRQIGNLKFEVSTRPACLDLRVQVPEAILTLPLKELALFRYFLTSTNANWLYLTNTSSYVRCQQLLNLLPDLPQEKVYGGWLRGERVRFASGANRLLSRDVVEFVVKNFHKWDFRFVDDLSLGLLLRKEPLHNPTIPTIEFSEERAIENASDEMLRNSIHFRLKAGPDKLRRDVALMRALHYRLVNLG